MGDCNIVDHRSLGQTGLNISPIGFGAFKIGRNQKTKYPTDYALPDLPRVETLLNGVLDMGINHIDTAPAYGISEERIGQAIAHRRDEFILSTKVGEVFQDGQSAYHFDADHVQASIQNSLRLLKTDVLDIVFIHCDDRDVWIQTQTDCVATLQKLKAQGLIKAIGLSGKTAEGFSHALVWADVLMLEYNLTDRQLEPVIAQAAGAEVGVICKKGLASGHLDPAESVRFVLANSGVTSLVVGSLNPDHLQENLRIASE